MRLTIFVHFNKALVIDTYVVYYVRALKEVSDEIIFVSASNTPKNEQAKISEYVDIFINRENVGYDFGSWKAGLEHIGYENLYKYHEIVLVNDSCYGPLIPFSEIFSGMQNKNLDAWSITTCYAVRYHMQSYFMVLKRSVFLTDWFTDFWKGVIQQSSKSYYVLFYEIGFSRLIVSKGLRIGGYYRLHWFLYFIHLMRYIFVFSLRMLFSKKFVEWRKRFYTDTSGYSVKQTIGIIGFVKKAFRSLNVSLFPIYRKLPPLVKVMLCRDNPFDVNLDKVKAQMKSLGYDVSMIEGRSKN